MATKKRTTNKKSFRETMRRWKTSDYLRQLSTVIIGIIVTFGGSGLIQRCSERRDTAHILEMVKDELEKNFSQVKRQKDRLVYEFDGAALMKPYMHNPELIQPDSLEKYIYAITSTRSPNFITNSFEVLKSSSQIQSIRNKNLLRDLFTAYEDMNHFQNQVSMYNSLKNSGIDEVLSSIDTDRYDISTRDSDIDAVMIFTDMMSSSLMQKYLVSTANNQNYDYLLPLSDSLSAGIAKVIESIDKEVGR